VNGSPRKFFPKDELGLCPKFTTKDSHTSLPRSRSHNGPTNPRNKPKLKATRKRNSRSKGLKQSAVAWADRPYGGGGLSAGTRRTFRKAQGGLSKIGSRTYSSALLKTDHPPTTCRLSAPGEPSAHSFRTVSRISATKITGTNGSKRNDGRTRNEHNKYPAAKLLVDHLRLPSGLSATRGQSSPSSKSQAPKHLSVHGSPKRLELLR
jgi:hypothetical protein